MEKASVVLVVTFLAACAPSAPQVAPQESMPAPAPAAPSGAPNVGPVAADAARAPSSAASGGVTPPPQSDLIPGWEISGTDRKSYRLARDTGTTTSGKASARLEWIGGDRKFGYLAQAASAERYRGKRVRLLGFVKGEAIGGRGDFWLRVQAADSPGDGPGLGGGSCRLHATFDFKRCEIVFDVPKAGESIELGIGLDGPGTIWPDDVKLEAVGKNVPLNSGLEHATNLDFEE